MSTRRLPSRKTPAQYSDASTQLSPYPLLSKTLTVANLPPEFCPKNLYDLFSEFGKAAGAFVYAFPDAHGRRVGEVAMSSYLCAQKVFLIKISDKGT